MIVPILIIVFLAVASRVTAPASASYNPYPNMMPGPYGEVAETRVDGAQQYGYMVPVPTVQPQFTAAASINPQNTFAAPIYEGATAGLVSGLWA
jgi:hypothetical protein